MKQKVDNNTHAKANQGAKDRKQEIIYDHNASSINIEIHSRQYNIGS
jgi:hypothetical protein